MFVSLDSFASRGEVIHLDKELDFMRTNEESARR